MIPFWHTTRTKRSGSAHLSVGGWITLSFVMVVSKIYKTITLSLRILKWEIGPMLIIHDAYQAGSEEESNYVSANREAKL